MKKGMQFSFYAKIILNVVVYVLFFVYLIYFILYGEMENKAPWMIVCVVAGVMALLYEILKLMYDLATKALIFDGEPLKTIKLINYVDKFDILKTFKSSTIMMRLLADIDSRDFDNLRRDINNIEDEKTNVKDDYDVNITSAYANMILCGEMRDAGKFKSAYHLLLKIKDTKLKKGKTGKGVYFFNWDVINGLKDYYLKEYEAAYKKLKDIETTNMNKREAMHLYIVRGITCKELGYKQEANNEKEYAIKLAGKNDLMIKYINETI